MPHQSCDVNTKETHARSNYSYHVTPLKAVQIQPDPVRTLTTCALKIIYSTTFAFTPSSTKQLLSIWFCKQKYIKTAFISQPARPSSSCHLNTRISYGNYKLSQCISVYPLFQAHISMLRSSRLRDGFWGDSVVGCG